MAETSVQEGGMTPSTTNRSELQACIDRCNECRAACLRTVSECLGMGGAHAAPEHVRLLLDCADICATSAAFMLRGSDMHAVTCGACAEVCRRCESSCRGLGMNDCAEACCKCAESCARMASGSQGAH
jgi:hypothetical protein